MSTDETPSLAEIFADVLDNMKQIEETSRGFREEMQRQGWSETASEAAALSFMQAMIMKAFA